MNLTTDQSCDHAVLKSSKHVKKFEKLKNLCLNLLYTYCSFSAVCSNHLASAVSIFLDFELFELMLVSLYDELTCRIIYYFSLLSLLL